MAALPRISSKLPPDIDPTKAPVAFGRRGLPKLNEELQDFELVTRQRALMALCDLVHDPEHAYEAIRLGFLETLKGLLSDEDATVRLKATEVLYIMATHSVGRTGFLEHGVIPALAKLLADPVAAVRWNMHYALKLVSEVPLELEVVPAELDAEDDGGDPLEAVDPLLALGALPADVHHLEGAVGIVEAGLVPSLVQSASWESEESLQALALETLAGCLRVEAFEALASGGVALLKNKARHPSNVVRSRATQALMAISVPLEGKMNLLEEDVFPDLVVLLEDKDPEVRANAAGTLMYAAITTPGKYAALEAGALEALLPLLRDPLSKVRLYALKALTVLSEAPEGRRALLPHRLAFQERIDGDPSPAVQRAAQIALRVVEWKP